MAHLEARFARNKIYTNVGDVLLAINPCKALSIYESDTQETFLLNSPFNSTPHIYSLALQSFKQLRLTGRKRKWKEMERRRGKGSFARMAAICRLFVFLFSIVIIIVIFFFRLSFSLFIGCRSQPGVLD